MVFEIHVPTKWWLKKFPEDENGVSKSWAFVAWFIIFIREDKFFTELRRHEWRHVFQIREFIKGHWNKVDRVIKWYRSWYLMRDLVGYWFIPVEIEARAIEGDVNYTPWMYERVWTIKFSWKWVRAILKLDK